MIICRQCDCTSRCVKIATIPQPKKKKPLAKLMKSHTEDKNTRVNNIPLLNPYKK